MTKDNGGPAFPSIQGQMASYAGMSLRDWFAGQALAGFCADPDMKSAHMPSMAYELADAMLAEREK